ncbi:MAG: hypothetical protein WKF45_07440, partial [Ilumatobacteraceae bacterium]
TFACVKSQPVHILDATSLRALAHPLRLDLLERLRRLGPAAATQLAAEFTETSGATSYPPPPSDYRLTLTQMQLAAMRDELEATIHRYEALGDVNDPASGTIEAQLALFPTSSSVRRRSARRRDPRAALLAAVRRFGDVERRRRAVHHGDLPGRRSLLSGAHNLTLRRSCAR